MRALRNLIPPPLAVIFCAAALGWGLSDNGYVPREIAFGDEQDNLIRPQPSTTSGDEIAKNSLSQNATAALVAAPIFAANRKPYEAPKPVRTAVVRTVVEPAVQPTRPVVQKIPLPNVSFLGVRISSDEAAALLRSKDRETWYRAGDTVGEWVVTHIGRTEIKLGYKDQEITINLTR